MMLMLKEHEQKVVETLNILVQNQYVRYVDKTNEYQIIK